MYIYHELIFLIFISGKDADLLIHEATLEDELKVEAVAKKHRLKIKYYAKPGISQFY